MNDDLKMASERCTEPEFLGYEGKTLKEFSYFNKERQGCDRSACYSGRVYSVPAKVRMCKLRMKRSGNTVTIVF